VLVGQSACVCAVAWGFVCMCCEGGGKVDWGKRGLAKIAQIGLFTGGSFSSSVPR